MLRSDSPEVLHALTSRDCVLADSPWTDLPGTIAGNFLIGILFLGLRTFEWDYRTRLVGALLIFWNGMRLAHATFSRRHWMVAACAERFYVRLFKPIGGGSRQDAEPDVMALDMAELAAIQIRTADVFVRGPKPKVYQWLVVEPVKEVRASVADQFEQLGPLPPGSCPIPAADGSYREWFTRYEGGSVTVAWHQYRPLLEKVLRQIASRFPNLTIRPEAHTELDLVSFINKPEPERRRLFVQAKRMGFSRDCVWALYSYTDYTLYQHRRSLKQSAEYMANIDIGAGEDAETAAPAASQSVVPASHQR
jgi:hypothetical protein